MAKSKIQEKHNLSVEGVLNIKDDKIVIEVEDLGDRNLATMMKSFDGDLVKISVVKKARRPDVHDSYFFPQGNELGEFKSIDDARAFIRNFVEKENAQ